MQRSIKAAFADPGSLALAFLLAPLFAGVMFAVTGIVFGIVTAHWGVLTAIASGLFLLAASIIGAAVLGYPIAATVGVLIYCLMFAAGYRSLQAYITAGAMLGPLVRVEMRLFYGASHIPSPGAEATFEGIVFWALCGAAAGFAFWRIARPDHLSAPARSGSPG